MRQVESYSQMKQELEENKMVGDKYFLKCNKGHEYEITLGVLGNFTCRVCGNTQVTIYPQVIQKSAPEKVTKNVKRAE